MRNFSGKIVSGKIVKRKADGGALPTNAAAGNAARIIGGLNLSPGTGMLPGFPDRNLPMPGATPPFMPASGNTGTPGKKKPSTQDLLQSALMGGLSGFGGPAGIASAIAMQAIPLLAEAMRKKSPSAAATQKKKGGGPTMKGKMMKPAKKMAPKKMTKMAYGGKTKMQKGGKAC